MWYLQTTVSASSRICRNENLPVGKHKLKRIFPGTAKWTWVKRPTSIHVSTQIAIIILKRELRTPEAHRRLRTYIPVLLRLESQF